MVKKNFLDRIFPVKYDFYKMLGEQAQINAAGVKALYDWLMNGTKTDMENLLHYVKDADTVRMNLEDNLIEAFTTPFDRGDIYSISVEMDRIIEYAKSTLLSMEKFEVKPDDIIINMAEKLKDGHGGILRIN